MLVRQLTLSSLLLLAATLCAASDAVPRHRGPITDLLIHGNRILSCSQAGVISTDLDGGNLKWLSQPDFRVYSLATIPGRPKCVLVGGGTPAESGIVAVLDIASGETMSAHKLCKDLVYSISVDAGGDKIAAACADGAIRALSLAAIDNDTISVDILHRHTATARDAAFSSDGTHLASCGHDGVVLLATMTGEHADSETRALHGHTAALHCLAFAPGGRRIASGSSNGKVRLHDIEGPQVRTYSGLDGEVSCLHWNAHGLFAGSSEGTVYRLSDDDDSTTTLTKIPDPIFAITSLPDGRLATASFALAIIRLPST